MVADANPDRRPSRFTKLNSASVSVVAVFLIVVFVLAAFVFIGQENTKMCVYVPASDTSQVTETKTNVLGIKETNRKSVPGNVCD